MNTYTLMTIKPPKCSSRNVIQTLIVTLLIWLTPTAIFLIVYIFGRHMPKSAILPHLIFVFFVLLCLLSIRTIIQLSARKKNRWKKISQCLDAGFCAILYISLVAYYFTVIIGLSDWGRVVSLGLIHTYLKQSSFVAQAFEIHVSAFYGSLVVAWVSVSSAFLLIHNKLDITQHLRNNFDSTRLVVASITLALTCALFFSYYAKFADANTGEPIALTIHPLGRQLQSHNVPISAKNIEAEHVARAKFTATPVQNKPNVILIVIDALRADHVPMNGYKRNTMPNLQRLASKGEILNVNNVYAACSETSCGMISMMSSRNVHRHVEKPLVLHEALKRNGYQTHMIMGGDHTNFYDLRSYYGNPDTYFDGSTSGGQYINDDQSIVEHFNTFPRWAGQPTYIQFHLMSCHSLSKRERKYAPFQPSQNYYRSLATKPSGIFGPNETVEHINHYDNGVFNSDRVTNQLLSALEQKGYLANSLVVVSADHGELLGEHNLFGHSKTVFEPVVRIPLMLMRQGSALKTQLPDEPAIAFSQIDIAPTIFFELGLQWPATWSGIPLDKSFGSLRLQHSPIFQQGQDVGLVRPLEGLLWKYRVNLNEKTSFAYPISDYLDEFHDESARLSTKEIEDFQRLLLDAEAIARDSARQ